MDMTMEQMHQKADNGTNTSEGGRWRKQMLHDEQGQQQKINLEQTNKVYKTKRRTKTTMKKKEKSK
jgi:hypothetical protein